MYLHQTKFFYLSCFFFVLCNFFRFSIVHSRYIIFVQYFYSRGPIIGCTINTLLVFLEKKQKEKQHYYLLSTSRMLRGRRIHAALTFWNSVRPKYDIAARFLLADASNTRSESALRCRSVPLQQPTNARSASIRV